MTRSEHIWVRVEHHWDGYPLGVRHLRPGETLTVGERGDVVANGRKRCLVTVEPERARLTLGEADELIELESARGTSPYRSSPQPRVADLGEGDTALVRIGACSVALVVERSAPRVTRRGTDTRFAAAFALSLAAVATLFVRLATASPALSPAPDDGIDPEKLRTLQAYLASAAEREQEVRETDQSGPPDEQVLYQLPPSLVLGEREEPECSQRPPHLRLRAARRFCCWGLPCGEDEPPPPRDWGEPLDPCASDDGGLPGIGEAPESPHSNTLAALLDAAVHAQHQTASPAGRIRAGSPAVAGALPAAVIQRVVRRHEDEFRRCYENGLFHNPNLAGRIATRFVIDRDGVVSVAHNGGSDLPDSVVMVCVIRRFSTLRFPAPQSGTVQVVYPLEFAPVPKR